jgi:hypothetical protein
MKRILFILVLMCLEKTLHAQYVYTIKADSVKITNTCDTAELIIENHTQTVPGFLFNKGRGRTEFRRGLLKITDSIYIVGGDTLKMNPWLQGGNRFGTTGVFGTMDNNHIDFYSNSIQRARLTNKGSLQIGSLAWDNEDKLQVGNNGAVTIAANLSRVTDRIQIGKAFNFGDGQNALIRTSSDNGATYKDILVERDGYIGLGTSNRSPGGWWVGNPALRILANGIVNIGSNNFVFGNTGGEWNASGLYTYVSNTDEWHTGLGQYPNRLHYYYFGTGLAGPEGTNVRANLKISGRELNFLTGVTEGEAMRIAESKNVLIGTTSDNGDRFQVWGNSTLSGRLLVEGQFYQAAPQTAVFGNGLYFDHLSGISRINSTRGIIYQANYAGDQHVFRNDVGEYLDGTLVTIDPGYNPTTLTDSQVVLKVLTYLRTPGLIVNMAGRVGVGTIDPTAKLHATGTVRFSDLTNDNSLARIVVSDANGNLYYRDASSLTLNETLNSDLAVNGRVSAQKMLITQTGRWPDYVFNKQYTLPSLSEVENFIKQNNHLPGIPSAAEIEKKGIDVGNNQAALLQKIEELTLYAIEQEKKIQKQNDQIKELLNLKQEMAELKALIKK